MGRALAETIAPVAVDNGLRPIGVGRSEGWLLTAWYYGQETIRDVNTLAYVHSFQDLGACASENSDPPDPQELVGQTSAYYRIWYHARPKRGLKPFCGAGS